jgi:hypothetical protein
MKKKIYIHSHEPSERKLAIVLDSLSPPLNPRIRDQLIISFRQIQTRIRDAAINQPSYHAHQTQSLSDGKHTVTLVGQVEQPSLLQKFMDIFH